MHLIEISSGELLDRLVISRLKITHSDGSSCDEITLRHKELESHYTTLVTNHPALAKKRRLLEYVNKRLWSLEDAIRAPNCCDVQTLSLQIIAYNDIRSQIKRAVDLVTSGVTTEFKSYLSSPLQKTMIEAWLEIELNDLSEKPSNMNNNISDILGKDDNKLAEFVLFISNQFKLATSIVEQQWISKQTPAEIGDFIHCHCNN